VERVVVDSKLGYGPNVECRAGTDLEVQVR